ncbi:hypothetical protein PMAYCL1PPCAC_03011, partial [Pristionchus mayeri]
PQAILAALVAQFGTQSDALSREEQRIKAAIASMLLSGRDGDLQFHQTDRLYVDVKGDEDSDWSGAEEDEPSPTARSSADLPIAEDGLIYFGGKGCTIEYVRGIYYREPEQ